MSLPDSNPDDLSRESFEQAEAAFRAPDPNPSKRVEELEDALAHLLDTLHRERPRYASEHVRQAILLARETLSEEP